MRLRAIMRTRSSCSSRLDRRGLAQAGGAAGRGAGVQTHEASGARRLAGVTRGVPTAGARTVPVEDAEESHSLLAPLAERVAGAAAVWFIFAEVSPDVCPAQRRGTSTCQPSRARGKAFGLMTLSQGCQKHQKVRASPIHASGVVRGRGARLMDILRSPTSCSGVPSFGTPGSSRRSDRARSLNPPLFCGCLGRAFPNVRQAVRGRARQPAQSCVRPCVRPWVAAWVGPTDDIYI